MTAVEWLEDCLTEQHPNGSFVWNTRADLEALFKQAKEMEKQQQDDFAIGFADWVRVCKLKQRPYDFENIKELLEIYKKEKGL
jgi:hypothetical protein